MKRLVHYAEARRILGKASLANRFWLCTNQNLRNLLSLADALEEVDDDVFRYHVNRDKNDFEVWIRDVIKDKELAREISRVKTKETLIRKIMERVASLRKVVRLHMAILERKRKKQKSVKKRKGVKMQGKGKAAAFKKSGKTKKKPERALLKSKKPRKRVQMKKRR